MSRRNWLLTTLCVIGVAWFILSRTVWGPPSRAEASHSNEPVVEADPEPGMSDARLRFLNHQPTHWRYLMMKH